MKVLILQSFHRFVPTGEFRQTPKNAQVEIERKESFPEGKTVEVSEEEAADWIAHALAKAAE